MTAYTCALDDQQIYIENQGSQTTIKLTSGSQSQQQSQSNSFATGSWRVPPTVFRTSNGVVLRIEVEQGEYFIGVQASRMSKLDKAPSLSDAEVIPTSKVDEAESVQNSMPDMKPMQPMEPMQPMQPMQMEPMVMQMGNMEMRMGTKTPPKQSAKNFCSQCGSKVAQSDHFCAHCGSSLSF